MDFLDPRKKRNRRTRLMISYGLMALGIGLGTILLVYGVSGYGFNPKTRQIVQNGLIFVGSQPKGARIYLNSKLQQNSSPARLITPGGKYILGIQKDGYRSWSHSLVLAKQSIVHYDYPFLFPQHLRPESLKKYNLVPGLITQSPNRRWLLVQDSSPSSKRLILDRYDTRKLSESPQTITLPANLFSGSVTGLKLVEWSSDNNHLLVQGATPSGSEFAVINTANPVSSFNINRMFKTKPSQVVLRDKKIDQVYIFNQQTATLRIGDTSSESLNKPFISHVLAFKAYQKNLVNYVTNTEQIGKVEARVWDNGQIYSLQALPKASQYFIDAGKYKDNWYYLAGTNLSDRVNIYKDPLSASQNQAFASLSVQNPQSVSFSPDHRFIMAQAGQSFALYDIPSPHSYHYSLKLKISGGLHWMDNSRLIGKSGNQVMVVDFDGTNSQVLSPTSLGEVAYFSSDYNHILTLVKSQKNSSITLQQADLRAGADLPD